MLSGGVLFGAVIGQMVRMLQMRNPHQRQVKLRLSELKAYMMEKNVPQALQQKTVVSYSNDYVALS
jgi:hypothetical protein